MCVSVIKRMIQPLLLFFLLLRPFFQRLLSVRKKGLDCKPVKYVLKVGGLLCVESSDHFTVMEIHLDPQQPMIKHGPIQHF